MLKYDENKISSNFICNFYFNLRLNNWTELNAEIFTVKCFFVENVGGAVNVITEHIRFAEVALSLNHQTDSVFLPLGRMRNKSRK